jgi:hypothetical protein
MVKNLDRFRTVCDRGSLEVSNRSLIRSFSITQMKLGATTSKFFNVRIALVVATLISLCVSNNVGSSFLPLPVRTALTTEIRQNDPQSTASRAPSAPGSDNLRVPILAQSQPRADKDQTTQTLDATLKAGFVLPNRTRVVNESGHRISLVRSPSVLQPPGRAPPLLPV